MTAARHIPPGREHLWRRQAEVDAEVARLDAAVDAAEKRRNDLAEALGWDDPLVDEADAEMADRLDERNRAVAVSDRIYQERTVGLSSWIDHDPTAPVCVGCRGAGCKACRGWGRERREPIPVWDDRDEEWVNPATGRPVDLLADPPVDPPVDPPPATGRQGFHGRDLHDQRVGRWYDTDPITTTTSAGGTGVASIEEVRAGIAAANEKANEGLGAVQQAHASLEEAQGALMRATEGSGQADVSEANGLLAQAVNSLEEVRQQVAAAISAAEQVANRL